MCNSCEYKQYCKDCKSEQEPIEVVVIQSVAKQDNNKVSIIGNYLYHKGRPFRILDKTRNKQMNQKLTINTVEGFIFHIREIGEKLVLTKILRTKPKNGGRPDCPECQKIFIGKIPFQLFLDPNW